jgi:crotonobetaine/carnitine-CoA ligase
VTNPPLAGGHESIRALLECRARELGPEPLLTLPDAQLTYAQTDDMVNRMAEVLVGLGYGVGDIVMSRGRNGWGLVATWLACVKLGAVYLPLNALLTGEPLRQVMAHSRGRVLVVDHDLLDDITRVRDGLPDLADVLVLGGPARAGYPRVEDLIGEASGRAPSPLTDDPGAPAKLMYTSGTTGVPKGVLWSRHCEALWANAYGEECLPIARGEGLYCCLPLFHITCQGTLLAAIVRGGHLTIDPGFSIFGFWSRIRAADAVMFTFVGSILSALSRRRPSPSDIENPVRRIVGAAAPIEPWRAIEDRFGLHIVETWGQTETASCWSWPARGLPQTPGTVGVPSERWEARIVGDGGASLGPGSPGELWMRPRGDHAMFEGYLGADGPSAPTRETWTDDGWYRTGDFLQWTDDGELQFIGRRRDAIRRAGEMIAPSFIEEAAVTHPGIVEAAAVGVPADDGVEEEVLLCIVAGEDVELDPAEVLSFLAGILPRYLVPRWLRIHGELPKTPTTRVRKFELRALGTTGAWDTKRRRPPGPSPAVEAAPQP